ncbi:helix-turn-helix transcriptional regulator [Kitasatospora purpeofusca]|uniref:helix-turn-helix transcriptional regulator n=1 Tax=Kitasatospora purpeofusca TaxID=67352 RepID=UPI0035D9E9E3
MATGHPHARELGEFLRARRARLRPQDVGLEPGGRRKVSGLRREEIALLAGLSTDYYQRMEQGRDVRPSDHALESLAGALQLDGDERRHLFDLARAARRPVRARPDHGAERVPESTRRLLHVLATPGLVLGRHLDVLAWNPLAEALLGDPAARSPAERNMLSVLFREPESRMLCPGWESMARQYVAMLRAAVADDPDHPRAAALVGELSIHSAAFRRLWARHDVRGNVHGTTLFQHPGVGGITLDWDTYPLPGTRGPVLLVFTAEPGTADADRLQVLASLHATRDAAIGSAPRRAG